MSWSVQELSEKTGVGAPSIVRYEEETGGPKSRKGNLGLLVSTLEAAGIEFIGTPDDRPGIRLRSPRA